uniref:Uncharacterized protein n=1 Tax=Poecilia latipinna TaxID=48699 RepID=A0A3B3V1B9_9TELE
CFHLNALAVLGMNKNPANPVTWNYNALRVNGDVCVLRRKITSGGFHLDPFYRRMTSKQKK